MERVTDWEFDPATGLCKTKSLTFDAVGLIAIKPANLWTTTSLTVQGTTLYFHGGVTIEVPIPYEEVLSLWKLTRTR